jgi:hypothetical protein
MGPEEAALASRVGSPGDEGGMDGEGAMHCITVSSGTEALLIAGQGVFLAALALGLWLGGLQGAAWAVSLGMLPYFGWYFWRLANWPGGPSRA